MKGVEFLIVAGCSFGGLGRRRELGKITGWLEQQRELYTGYYQELRQVGERDHGFGRGMRQ